MSVGSMTADPEASPAEVAVTSSAYAVVGETGILVDTVSSSRRAAITNWLVVCARVLILNNNTDEQIEELWRKHKRGEGVCKVEIKLLGVAE